MKIFSIAEIGVNHMGGYEQALRMIYEAKVCGATAVKFQKYNPIKLLGKDSPYLKDAHQLSWQELTDLSEAAHQWGLQFGCSVFDINDIPIADKIVDFHKIATRMNRNAEFVSRIEQCKRLTFMSVQPTVDMHVPDRFKLLWCIAEYPSLKEDILKYPYQDIGLSSHCPDWTATLEAVKLGARVIENHVCMSKEDIGCDIPASLDFNDYGKLIKAVENL